MPANDSVFKLEKKNPVMNKDSFQSLYKEMDAFSVYVAFLLLQEINELDEKYARDVKEFIMAEVNETFSELEKRKGRSWMIRQALMLQRMQALSLSNNRKTVDFLLYAYDIEDSMFVFEKHILKIVLNIDAQVKAIEVKL